MTVSKRQIVISSKDRVSGQSLNSITVELKNNLQVYAVELQEFVTHHSVLPFSLTADTMYWTVSATPCSSLMVAPTSWTGAGLATALQSTLNIVGPAGFTVVYNSLTGKFQITNAAAFYLQFNSMQASNRLWELLGFPRLTVTASGTSLISTYMARIQGVSKYFINSVNLARQKTYMSPTQTLQGSTIQINNSQSVFAVIPIKVNLMEAIEFNKQNYASTEYQFGNTSVLQTIDISITDEYGNLLPVEDEWTLVLSILVIQD